MGSRLADFYEKSSRDTLNRIEQLDYAPDFYRKVPGSHYERCVHMLEPLIGSLEDPRALEIGVGSGALLHWLRHAGASPAGVEISQYVVELMREKGFDMYRTDINEEPLPFDDNSFNLVVSMDVIEHVICPVTFMKEVYRVCEPGGHALISTANSRTFKAVYRLLVHGRFPWTSEGNSGWDSGHLHYFTSRDVAHLGRGAGFSIERIEGASLFPPGFRGFLKRAVFGLLPAGFTREFFAGTFLVLFRK